MTLPRKAARAGFPVPDATVRACNGKNRYSPEADLVWRAWKGMIWAPPAAMDMGRIGLADACKTTALGNTVVNSSPTCSLPEYEGHVFVGFDRAGPAFTMFCRRLLREPGGNGMTGLTAGAGGFREVLIKRLQISAKSGSFGGILPSRSRQ